MKRYTENQLKHLAHPFYDEVENYREEVRMRQILKGADKYPEPFKPENYSAEELLQHAMEENVDQGHYIYGLHEKLEQEREMRNESIDSALVALRYLTEKAKNAHDYVSYHSGMGAILILEKLKEI